jgi:hypothetical protein
MMKRMRVKVRSENVLHKVRVWCDSRRRRTMKPKPTRVPQNREENDADPLT